jgi:hypothetical protein
MVIDEGDGVEILRANGQLYNLKDNLVIIIADAFHWVDCVRNIQVEVDSIGF